jgi:Fe-S-cluster-containing hydrogenase component 2
MLEAINQNCSGCRTCLLACAIQNQGEVNPKKAALAIEGHFPAPGGYEVRLCNQCGACADVCPVEAIQLVDGAYRIDREECSGCGACIDECPQGVIFRHPDSEIPIKCVDCGLCVEVCPRGAIISTGEATS